MIKNRFFQLRVQRKDGDGEGGNGGNANWRDSLPDDIKGSSALADVKDIPSLAKQFIDAQSFIGRSVRIPGEDAGEEDWNKFHEKVLTGAPTLMRKPDPDDEKSLESVLKSMGMPEDKSKYSVEGIKVDGVEPTEGEIERLRDIAAEAKMTQKQFENYVRRHFNDVATKVTEQQTKVKEGIDALKGEWGMAYDQNLNIAVDVLKKTNAPDSLIRSAEKGEVSADTIKWAHGLAKALGSEGTPASGDGKGTSDPKLTPAEAANKIAEIMGNKQHPYWNGGDPRHKAAIDRMVELQRAANPQG